MRDARLRSERLPGANRSRGLVRGPRRLAPGGTSPHRVKSNDYVTEPGLDIRQGLWYNAGAQIQVSVLPPARGMSEAASIMRYVPVRHTAPLFRACLAGSTLVGLCPGCIARRRITSVLPIAGWMTSRKNRAEGSASVIGLNGARHLLPASGLTISPAPSDEGAPQLGCLQ